MTDALLLWAVWRALGEDFLAWCHDTQPDDAELLGALDGAIRATWADPARNRIRPGEPFLAIHDDPPRLWVDWHDRDLTGKSLLSGAAWLPLVRELLLADDPPPLPPPRDVPVIAPSPSPPPPLPHSPSPTKPTQLSLF